jgi:hypothetical protein
MSFFRGSTIEASISPWLFGNREWQIRGDRRFLPNSSNATTAVPAKRSRKSAEDSGRYNLQILLHPFANPIERFLDVLNRVCDAETQITFAKVAERGAGERGHAGIVEKCIGQFFR